MMFQYKDNAPLRAKMSSVQFNISRVQTCLDQYCVDQHKALYKFTATKIIG